MQNGWISVKDIRSYAKCHPIKMGKDDVWEKGASQAPFLVVLCFLFPENSRFVQFSKKQKNSADIIGRHFRSAEWNAAYW